jgi:hypothetical protein
LQKISTMPDKAVSPEIKWSELKKSPLNLCLWLSVCLFVLFVCLFVSLVCLKVVSFWNDKNESPLRTALLKKADFYIECTPLVVPLPPTVKLCLLLHTLWGHPFRMSILKKQRVRVEMKKQSTQK